MNIEQERAEFEAWFTKTIGYVNDQKDVFARVVRDIAWEAWKRRAALQSQDREDDPLQPAANWLIQAITSCTVADIQGRLSIGYNRAQRLFDHARRIESKESK